MIPRRPARNFRTLARPSVVRVPFVGQPVERGDWRVLANPDMAQSESILSDRCERLQLAGLVEWYVWQDGIKRGGYWVRTERGLKAMRTGRVTG
jgi:hypothetical protein